MSSLSWPAHWQPEAVAAATAFVDTDARIEVVVGDPDRSTGGTVLAGYLCSDDAIPMMIYDRSGRADLYPWPLLDGPVLRIYELAAHSRKRRVVYAHPKWSPRPGA